ncbi:MAG: DUF4375 domain-containing protein [Sphingobacteriales bacterium]|nr:DUF4375 domain-containing protein [Sphingobacteriales bacterium]OJW30966.1 MAG: hypothetical protein BGO54_21390 [Sphingobacteriales bacterium 46-32]
MTNDEIIKEKFDESVIGIDEKILKNENAYYNHVVNMPQHLQLVYTVIVFHNQVYNGGLHQYFFNKYGMFGYRVIEYLKLIKCYKRVNILEKAIKEINKEGWSEAEFRKRVFSRTIKKVTDFDEDLFDFLDELDDEYYELEDEEDLEIYLGEYLKSL